MPVRFHLESRMFHVQFDFLTIETTVTMKFLLFSSNSLGTSIVQTSRKSIFSTDSTKRIARRSKNEKFDWSIFVIRQRFVALRTRLSSALVRFEIFHWKFSISTFRYNTLPTLIQCLSHPILTRHTIIRQFEIHYDPTIDLTIRQCQLLAQNEVCLPDFAYQLLLDHRRLRLFYERLKVNFRFDRSFLFFSKKFIDFTDRFFFTVGKSASVDLRVSR